MPVREALAAKQRLAAAIIAAAALLAADARAEPIKIDCSQIAQSAPTFIAKEKGYFAAEGLDAELVFFDAAEPMAVAAASGGVDFAVAGTSAGL